MVADSQQVTPQFAQDHARRLMARRIRGLVRSVLIHASLIPAALIFTLPFMWMLSTSLKPRCSVLRLSAGYLSFTSAVVQLPRCGEVHYVLPLPQEYADYCSAGYDRGPDLFVAGRVQLARIPWPGRNFLFILTVATLMLPFQVTMIPLFIVFKNLGWVNSWLPLIVPHWFGGALYIFLLRQFFMTIPMELSEAARIDGASELKIYYSILLPLSQASPGYGCNL